MDIRVVGIQVPRLRTVLSWVWYETLRLWYRIPEMVRAVVGGALLLLVVYSFIFVVFSFPG
jgi:hypothetical protein